MVKNKQKLELTWIGKDERPRLEPRILLENMERSYHAAHRVSDDDIFDNVLIKGDNLLALKALEQDYSGKVKCIYIDPPYNTGSAFTHYEDGIEHSLWLSLMRDRVELLRKLLSDDGSIWIHCSDDEGHYLKVVCDEIFGRANFITSFIWQKVDSPNDNKVPITPDHEYIHCYAKTANGTNFKQKSDLGLLNAYRKDDVTGVYYRDRLLRKNGKNSLRVDRPSMFFAIEDPDGNAVFPIHDDGQEARWSFGKQAVEKMVADKTLIWKKRKDGVGEKWVPYTREFAQENPTRPYPTIWTDVQTSRQAKAHQKALLENVPLFDTPKPEPLIERILEISSDEGDLVLDSFGGSGTTAAVGHKMRRRWIMVELGDHCYTHIVPRLKKVIDGEDHGGITTAVEWKGGGGFRFYELAPSLLKRDKWDNYIINPEYNAEMLAEAMCKNLGFTYKPSEDIYWIHGHSTETDFIYVTTQNLTREMLQVISDEVGDDRTLLICCKAFRAGKTEFSNLTLEKIPNAILKRCEWDKDDYSLQIENLPMKQPEPGTQAGLFGEEAE